MHTCKYWIYRCIALKALHLLVSLQVFTPRNQEQSLPSEVFILKNSQLWLYSVYINVLFYLNKLLNYFNTYISCTSKTYMATNDSSFNQNLKLVQYYHINLQRWNINRNIQHVFTMHFNIFIREWQSNRSNNREIGIKTKMFKLLNTYCYTIFIEIKIKL